MNCNKEIIKIMKNRRFKRNLKERLDQPSSALFLLAVFALFAITTLTGCASRKYEPSTLGEIIHNYPELDKVK